MATGHFLITRRSSLIDQITSVDPVLDKLLERELLTDEQYNTIRCGGTQREKVRQLLDLVRPWGDSYKDEVCFLLRDQNPCASIFTEERPPDLITDWGTQQRGRKVSGASPTSPTSPKELSSHRVHNCDDILLIGFPAAFQKMAMQRHTPDTVEQYGDILEVECTGASQFTARRNGLKEAGRQASFIIAEEDAAKLPQYRDVIMKVAKARNVDPALIAAIISRESRFGNLLKNGWGHDRECFGLMQVSKLHHEVIGEWNNEEHINQATGILVDMIEAMQRKFPEWRPACQLKAGIASYNCGPTVVWDYEEIDKETVAKDYSNDVAARAQWFKKKYFPPA